MSLNEETTFNRKDSFYDYIEDIGFYPLLTLEEEKKYGEDLKKIDNVTITNQKVKSGIVMHSLNLPLVFACFTKMDKYEDILNVLIEYYKNSNKTKDELEVIAKYQKLTKKKERVLNINELNEIFNVTLDENSLLDKEDLLNQIKDFINYNEAFDKMLLGNLRLVISIALDFHKQFYALPIMDLISEGNSGLMKAITKFDYSKGFKFSTYATCWIKNYIKRNIIDSGCYYLKVPTNVNTEISKFFKKVESLEKLYQRTLTSNEIAKELGMDLETVNNYFMLKQPVVYLDSFIDKEEETKGSVLDTIADNNDVENAVFNKIMPEELTELFKALNEREIIIIKMRYGINEKHKEYSLYEVSQVLGVTRERVRQLEVKAITKMRRFVEKNKIYIR